MVFVREGLEVLDEKEQRSPVFQVFLASIY